MDSLVNYLHITKTNSITPREQYAACLPDEIVDYIFNFLPLEEQTSDRLARVSYQFYMISKPKRDKFNEDLSNICAQISKVVADAFHRITTPAIFGVHYDFVEEQRFFIDFYYLYNANTRLTSIECKIEKQAVDDDNIDTVDRVLDIGKLNLGNTNFVLVDKIDHKKNYFFFYSLSTKIKLLADPSLKKELQTVANRVLSNVNKYRY